MGFGPHVVDLDSDGHLDLISGSWPGETFLFRGRANHSFAPPEMIQDKYGHFINIGGGITERAAGGMFSDGGLLITGNATFERTSKGIFVDYHGKRLESTPEKPIAITGTASTVHPADWDGDGDYDLIIGDIRGNLWLVPNEGSASSYAFGKEQRLQAGARNLTVQGKAGPCAADWDRDGDLDLLVGMEDGSVVLCENTGSAKSPKLSAAVQLVPPGVNAPYGSDAPVAVCRGTRSKICVADWNGDAWPDLLVGDNTRQKPDLPEPTAEEEAEYARIRQEIKPLQDRSGELMQQIYGRERVRDKEKREAIQKEMGPISERLRELRAKLPPEYETHRWVWLFLRTQ